MIDSDGAGRVLIIDDDPLVGQMLRAHVEAAGFEGRVTDDAATFFEIERQWHPTHVVVDLVMDHMDGLAVLDALAKAGSEAAVVISSGMGARVIGAAQEVTAAHGLTYAGALAKPFTAADVEAVLSATPNPRRQAALGSDEPLSPWDDPQFVEVFQRALDDGDVRFALQPKVSCRTRAVVGYEVLSRWEVDGVPVPPSIFVTRAEKTGLAAALTDRVFADALAWFADVVGPGDEHLSINLSASEFSTPGLDQRLAGACKKAGVDPHRVILELTETSPLEDARLSLELLTRLRLQGFRLSIDDFGVGYSSMRQLAALPFSEVKIDRSFVMEIAETREAEIFVRSMLDLAHALGLECTAEGVECAAVIDLLTEFGCDHAQGFHIARPMFPEALASWTAPALRT
ncbi:EAL domain-containing response regulator [Demequina muriae]|uniref:EAL domain-containing response regulator n=1 Tax=Demequina muriae TaxID=3051664 RepID=A0ABT8GIM2_9MICO|nr:EAL domain-containing response regulator [Demequina sp. EGI L300058]MDN4481274.1 EAL domain-containing response regulator [Demequina sp. EGI L300058]